MQAGNFLEPVVALAGQAATAILEVYAREDFEERSKADASPVTAADLAAHRILAVGLQALTPDIPVLSEEAADIPWQQRRQWTRYWLVDPLDGTREFLKRNGEFTVNIALVEHGEPVLGVVHVPVSGLSYLGLRGSGAWKRQGNAQQAIGVSALPAGGHSLRVVASRSHRNERLQQWLDLAARDFPGLQLLSMGSSLKICLVAEGSADLYPRLGPTSEWDTAAAQAVLEAAGGQLLDAGWQPHRYNRRPALLNPDFFALGDPALLQLLRQRQTG